MTDLIKRDDAMAAIDGALDNATGDLFDCHAAIRALPAVKVELIEELVRKNKEVTDALVATHWLFAENAKNRAAIREAALQAKLAKAMEALREIITRWDTPAWKDAEATGSIINRARTTLDDLEGGKRNE
jgi:uncharacterized membrane protein YccC